MIKFTKDDVKALIELWTIQDGLNKVLDEDWTSHRSKSEFRLAYNIELSEFLNTLRFKWWQKCPHDYQPKDEFITYLEFVDMLHFALSEKILNSKTDLFIYDPLNEFDTWYCDVCTSVELRSESKKEFPERLLQYVELAVCEVEDVFVSFLMIANDYRFDLKKVANIYKAKNALNSWRWKHNYDKKFLIGGKNDDYYLQEVLGKSPEEVESYMDEIVRLHDSNVN